MNWYPVRIPFVLPWLFPSLLYKLPQQKPTVYISFDDGPHRGTTPWLLDFLKQEQIPASFFCTGKNIEKNPDLFRQIINEKHTVGNHTYYHLDAWKTNTDRYLEDVAQTEKLFIKYGQTSKLFRPPYGRFTPKLLKRLTADNYQIVMWSWLAGDFSPDLNTGKVIHKLSRKVTNGDILVFHDSPKAFKHVKIILPKIVRHLKNQGFEFAGLP